MVSRLLWNDQRSKYLLNSRNIIRQDVPAHNHRSEGHVFTSLRIHLHWLDVSNNSGGLARTSRLLLVRLHKPGALRNGLSEGNLRIASDVFFPLAFDIDLEVKLEMMLCRRRQIRSRVMS